jgi:hypothetical protein
MEVTCYSITSVDLQQTIWRYIPEDRTLKNRSTLTEKKCIGGITNNKIIMKPHTESIVRVQSTIPIQCCLQYVKEE